LFVSITISEAKYSFPPLFLVFLSFTDNLSSCSSTSSQSSAMGNSPHESDAASSSSPTSLCGWCQKPGLKLFTLRTADGCKAFCSELCFTQCRRASFKKNKICNWCKHVRHTVNYVDYFDGKSQLQFCSTKCLGQYKMNIVCREIELNSPQIRQSLQASSSSSSLSPDSSARQMESAVVANSTQFPVDLCMKRKSRSQTEGGSGRHEEDAVRAEDSSGISSYNGRRSQNANLALEKSQIPTPGSAKRHKSHRKSGDEHKKCEDPLRGGKSVPLLMGQSNGQQEHHLRLQQQQQIHLQQQLHQLQTRLSLTPEIMFRSLNGKEAAIAAGHERLISSSCGVRRERGHALPHAAAAAAALAAAAPFLHQHLPPGLPPPPPLHTHHQQHHRFPTSSSSFRPTSSSLLPHHQRLCEGLPLTLSSEFLKPTRNSMKSEPAASSSLVNQTSNRKRHDHHHNASRPIETPAEEIDNPDTSLSHCPGHPHPPPHADIPSSRPPAPSSSLVVPMPVVLPFPVPIPVPLFFFQPKALQKIEQLSIELKQEYKQMTDRRPAFADKSTQYEQ
jgi:hypothetical protein